MDTTSTYRQLFAIVAGVVGLSWGCPQTTSGLGLQCLALPSVSPFPLSLFLFLLFSLSLHFFLAVAINQSWPAKTSSILATQPACLQLAASSTPSATPSCPCPRPPFRHDRLAWTRRLIQLPTASRHFALGAGRRCRWANRMRFAQAAPSTQCGINLLEANQRLRELPAGSTAQPIQRGAVTITVQRWIVVTIIGKKH